MENGDFFAPVAKADGHTAPQFSNMDSATMNISQWPLMPIAYRPFPIVGPLPGFIHQPSTWFDVNQTMLPVSSGNMIPQNHRFIANVMLPTPIMASVPMMSAIQSIPWNSAMNQMTFGHHPEPMPPQPKRSRAGVTGASCASITTSSENWNQQTEEMAPTEEKNWCQESAPRAPKSSKKVSSKAENDTQREKKRLHERERRAKHNSHYEALRQMLPTTTTVRVKKWEILEQTAELIDQLRAETAEQRREIDAARQRNAALRNVLENGEGT